MTRVVVRAVERLRGDGVVHTMHYVRHRVSEYFYEHHFGIATAGQVTLESLGLADPLRKLYSPVPFRSFKAVMKHVAVNPGKDVFIDYGAGKGRAVILAATYRFGRVIGVEIAPQLSRIAIDNVRRAGRLLKCRDVRILTVDAADFVPPDDATVLHFFNPFLGELLDRVVAKIGRSIERVPRPVTFLVCNPFNFEKAAKKCSWLVPRREVEFAYKVPGVTDVCYFYRIYDAGPRRPEGLSAARWTGTESGTDVAEEAPAAPTLSGD